MTNRSPRQPPARSSSASERASAIGGTPDFDSAGVTLNSTKVVYGSVITALVNVVVVAAVIYFVVVVPMTRLEDRMARGAEADIPAPSDEAKILTEIRDTLRQHAPRS